MKEYKDSCQWVKFEDFGGGTLHMHDNWHLVKVETSHSTIGE